MKRIIALVLALVASAAFGAAVNIPVRNPSGGGYNIKGVTDGSSACTGCVGEILTASTAAGFTPVTGTYSDCVHLSLSPGTYLVNGTLDFTAGSSIPTSPTAMVGIIAYNPGSPTSVPTAPDTVLAGGFVQNYGLANLITATHGLFFPTGTRALTLTAATTVVSLLCRLDASAMNGALWDTSTSITAIRIR